MPYRTALLIWCSSVLIQSLNELTILLSQCFTQHRDRDDATGQVRCHHNARPHLGILVGQQVVKLEEIILISCLRDERFDYVVFFQGAFADATIPGPALLHSIGRLRKTAGHVRILATKLKSMKPLREVRNILLLKTSELN